MKLNRTVKLIGFITFSVLIVMALAFVFSQPASAHQNWPKNDDSKPDPFENVTFDPAGGELNNYHDQGGEWLIEDGDDISYSGISDDDPPVPGELAIDMEHNIRIQDGGTLTLENVKLAFRYTGSGYGHYDVVQEGSGSLVGKNLSIEHDIIITGDVVIDSDTTYSNIANETRIVIEGNLTIRNGATLTLDDVTVRTEAADPVNKVVVEAGATLVMRNGAVLESLSTDVNEDIIVHTLEAHGTLDVTDSTIMNHGTLIDNSGSSITDSTITTSAKSPFTTIDISGDGITPTIDSCTIESSHGKGVGIHVGGGADPTISGNIFRASANGAFDGGWPILVEDQSNPTITQNTFGDSGRDISVSCIKAVGSEPKGAGGAALADDNTFGPKAPRYVAIYWYITVEVLNSNNDEGIMGALVEYEEENDNYAADSGNTDEDGMVVFELPDYTVTRSGGIEYGMYYINASSDGEMASDTSDVIDNDKITLYLNIITYDYWPVITSDLVNDTMTIGRAYTIGYVINNEGVSNEGVVDVEFSIDGVVFGGADTILVDESPKIMSTEIVLPADAASTIDLKIEIIFADDQNPANNSQTLVGIHLNSPPEVTITSHAMDEEVSGIVPIAGGFSDDDGADDVTDVKIRVDGGAWEDAQKGTDTWQYDWDTTYSDNELHTLEVAAWDALGIMSEITSVNLSLMNLPAIEITPLTDDTVNGAESGDSVDISGTTTENEYSGYEISRVNITIKKKAAGSLDDEIIVDDAGADQISGSWENWKFTWTGINSLADGEYEIMASVYDAQDFYGEDTYTVTVKADNPASDPVINITTESPFSLDNPTNTIEGTAADDYMVTLVQYKLAGDDEWEDAVGTDTWSFDVLKTIVEPGESDVYEVRAYDGQGYSAIATITVERPNPTYDLGVSNVQITGVLKVGAPATLGITITKTGTGNIEGVDLTVYIGTGASKVIIADKVVANFSTAQKTETIVFTPTIDHIGLKDITVVIDPSEKVNDPDRSNNEVLKVTTAVQKGDTGDDDSDDDSPIPGAAFTVLALVAVIALFALRRRQG